MKKPNKTKKCLLVSVANKTELAKELRKLSRQMERLGLRMDYYYGFGEIAKHGRELIGASVIARGWADEIVNV